MTDLHAERDRRVLLTDFHRLSHRETPPRQPALTTYRIQVEKDWEITTTSAAMPKMNQVPILLLQASIDRLLPPFWERKRNYESQVGRCPINVVMNQVGFTGFFRRDQFHSVGEGQRTSIVPFAGVIEENGIPAIKDGVFTPQKDLSLDFATI